MVGLMLDGGGMSAREWVLVRRHDRGHLPGPLRLLRPGRAPRLPAAGAAGPCAYVPAAVLTAIVGAHGAAAGRRPLAAHWRNPWLAGGAGHRLIAWRFNHLLAAIGGGHGGLFPGAGPAPVSSGRSGTSRRSGLRGRPEKPSRLPRFRRLVAALFAAGCFSPTSSSFRSLVSGEKNRLMKVMIAPTDRITAGDSHMSCPSIAAINGILCAHHT